MSTSGMLSASAPAATAMQAPTQPTATAPAAQPAAPSTTKAAKVSGVAPKAPALSDPILKQIEAGIEAKVPPQLRSMYKSIVVAGMAVMFSAKTHDLVKKRLASSNDLSSNVSTGIANMIAGLSNEILHKLPPDQKQAFLPAAILASLTLMCQLLNYAEKTGGPTMTPAIVEGCVQATTRAVLQKFGVGQQQIQQAVQQGKQRQAGGSAQLATAPAQAAPPGGMLAAGGQ